MAIVKNKARCLRCKTVIESRHRHDWQPCLCGAIYVDGGLSYLRRGGELELIEELSERDEPPKPKPNLNPKMEEVIASIKAKQEKINEV